MKINYFDSNGCYGCWAQEIEGVTEQTMYKIVKYGGGNIMV